MLLDFVESLTHSSYLAHSSGDAAGNRVCSATFPPSPVDPVGTEDFESNSGASGIVLKLSLPDS
jgi:hypothetical protein